jgi:FMN phosphatase YigB (HAD superfamily)
MNIILDYNRTLFNPDTSALFPGVLETLAELAKGHSLFLVSRLEPRRASKLVELGIAEFLTDVRFVEEKTEEVFSSFVFGAGRVVVVGDRVQEEIRVGNALGYTTVLVQQGRFVNELPQSLSETPAYAISDIRDLVLLINTL